MPKRRVDFSEYQTRSPPQKFRKITTAFAKSPQYVPEQSPQQQSPRETATKFQTYKPSSPEFRPSPELEASAKVELSLEFDPLPNSQPLPVLRQLNRYRLYRPPSLLSPANGASNSPQYYPESPLQSHIQDAISSDPNTTASKAKSLASSQTSVKSPSYSPESPQYLPSSPEYAPKSPQYMPESPLHNLQSPHFQPVSPSEAFSIQGKASIKDGRSDTFSLPPTPDLSGFPTRSKVREWSSAFPEEEFLEEGIIEDPFKGKFGWKTKEAERARAKIAETHGEDDSGHLELKAELEEDDAKVSDLDIGEPLLDGNVRLRPRKERKRKNGWGCPTHREFHTGKKVYFLNPRDWEIEAEKLKKRRPLQKQKSGLGRSHRVMKYNKLKGAKAARGPNGRFVSTKVEPEH